MSEGRGLGRSGYLVLSLLATLLFLQSLREFFASVYYMNLVTLSINSSVLYTLLLFSPAVYIAFRPRNGWIVVLSVTLLAAFRIGMNLSWGTGLYLPLSGLTVAAYFVLLPALLHLSKSGGRPGWLPVGVGIAAGLAVDAVLLLLLASRDISAVGLTGLYITVPFGALAIVTSLTVGRVVIPEVPKVRQPGWKMRLAGLSLGAWIFLEYAILAAPFNLSRWNSLPLLAVSVGSVVGLLVPVAWATRPFSPPHRPIFLTFLGALAFVVLLDHTLFHSVLLPVLLVPAQAAMVMVLFYILSVLEGNSLKGTAKALLYSSLVLLLLVFIYVFTLTFGYVPLRSLWEGTEVFLIPVAALLVLLAFGVFSGGFRKPLSAPPLPRRMLGSIVIVLLLLSVSAFPSALRSPQPGNTLTIVTYNIHQGFNNAGVIDPEIYASIIDATGADVVALQESDTARLTSANLDVVGYLATRLGYHSYYGPPTREQTFGIALLSRYPIREATYTVLTSSEDNRNLLEARLDFNGMDVWVFVVHFALGAEDREIETTQVLSRAAQVGPHLIIAGDFNSCPGGRCPEYDGPSDQVYETVTTQYLDAWVAAGFGRDDTAGYTYSAADPFERIDYIFVSSGVAVSGAERIRSDLAVAASDHLPVLATLDFGP